MTATVTNLWKDRRVVVGASVGGAVLLLVIWVVAGRTGNTPATAASAASAASAAAPGAAPPVDKHAVETGTPAETYPIPSETIANQIAAARVAAKTPASTASVARDSGARSFGVPPMKAARDRAQPSRKGALTGRGEGRGNRTRGAAATALRSSGAAPPSVSAASSLSGGSGSGAGPDGARRSADSMVPEAAPPSDLKKRIPLVDDSGRVPILE